MNPYTAPRAEVAPYLPHGPPDGNAPVTEGSIDLLRQTRPWVQLFSILCFLGTILALLAAIAATLVGAIAPKTEGAAALPGWLGIVYVPLAALYIYPGIKLWSYASAIGRLVATRTARDLEDALRQQKSFWKFSGIAAIVTVVLYIAVIVGAVIFGIMTAASKH